MKGANEAFFHFFFQNRYLTEFGYVSIYANCLHYQIYMVYANCLRYQIYMVYANCLCYQIYMVYANTGTALY